MLVRLIFIIRAKEAMATLVGIRPSSFKGDRGETISGRNICPVYPLEKSEGQGTGRVFLTDDRLLRCGYSPKVGDDVRVEYNRFGKPAGIFPEDRRSFWNVVRHPVKTG